MKNYQNNQSLEHRIKLLNQISYGLLVLAFSSLSYVGYDLYRANKKHEMHFMKQELGVELVDNQYRITDLSKLESTATKLGIPVINQHGKYILANANEATQKLAELSPYLIEARSRGIPLTAFSGLFTLLSLCTIYKANECEKSHNITSTNYPRQ